MRFLLQTKSPKSRTPGFAFTAIINTNHQRKKITVKKEIFLYNRRSHLFYVTGITLFNVVLGYTLTFPDVIFQKILNEE